MAVVNSGLDIAELDKTAGSLFTKGIAESTQRTYKSGQTRFLNFCALGNFTAVPVTETVLCYFVARLSNEGLKHRTIKVYLSAVRHLHIAEGKEDPFLCPMNRLHALYSAGCEERGGIEVHRGQSETTHYSLHLEEDEARLGRKNRGRRYCDVVGSSMLGLP